MFNESGQKESAGEKSYQEVARERIAAIEKSKGMLGSAVFKALGDAFSVSMGMQGREELNEKSRELSDELVRKNLSKARTEYEDLVREYEAKINSASSDGEKEKLGSQLRSIKEEWESVEN